MKEDDKGASRGYYPLKGDGRSFSHAWREVAIIPLPRICTREGGTGDTVTHYSVQLPQSHLCNSFIATFPTYVQIRMSLEAKPPG